LEAERMYLMLDKKGNVRIA